MRNALASIAAAIVLCHASFARAVTQPNGTTIPTPTLYCDSGQPGGLSAVFACACTQNGVCNIGASCPGGSSQCDPGKNGTCEATIWHSVNDNSCIPSNQSGLDPVTDAATTPETFHPTCALTFTLLSRGTAIFKNVFGWYNVTGSKPLPSDLHPMLGCSDTTGKSVVLDLSSEPAYKGGNVGFFLLTPESHASKGTCDSGDCCPSLSRLQSGTGYVYYSEKKYNPDQAASAFVHLLIYDSHLSTQKFYFAWEDMFGGNDNEFTDLVTSVEGVECSGGGESCDTGQPGACAMGITSCSAGKLDCQSAIKPRTETCNGVDDDCNGKVDDGATCPDSGHICYQGTCVKSCAGGEFPCAGGATCDDKSGLCVDPKCVGVSCTGDTVCRAGKCAAACDGVVCPHGQTCVGNACVDLCKGATCAAGEVCRDGVCLPGCGSCSGVTCKSPLTCDSTTHDCVDPSCPAGCPTGQFCKSGSCVDNCDGAVCPDGQTCHNGQCASGAANPDGGLPAPDGGLGGNGSGGSSAANPENLPTTQPACSCIVAGGTQSGESGLAFLAFGALLLGFARRRRRRRAA